MLAGERTTPEVFAARQARLKAKHGNRTGNGAGADLAMAVKNWPTARVSAGGYTRDNGDPAKQRPTLEGMAIDWNTPTAADGKKGADKTRRDTGNPNSDLPTQLMTQWRTPLAGSPNATRGGGQDPAKRLAAGRTVELRDQVKAWATPKATDGEKGGPNMSQSGGGTPLPAMAVNWPTPMARDHRSGSTQKTDAELWGTKGRPLERVAFLASTSHSTPPLLPNPLPGATSSKSGPTLNPRFVEYLMAWSLGWTSFACSETVFTHWQARMRTELSRLCSREADNDRLI